MTRRVLSVGQCGPDQAAITRFLQGRFDVQVDRADQAADTLAALHDRPYDLVLINRKLDIDYSDGLEILRLLKADPRYQQLPVMLITNYPEYQDNAVMAGAVYGFGKQEFGSSDAVQRLEPYLGTARAASQPPA
jgi:two-component system, response regulator, stage 0 sporulation protein F